MMNGNKGKLAVLLALVMALMMVVTAMPAMAETYYSKDAGVYCLALSLAIAAVLALLLPSKCDQPTKPVSQQLDEGQATA